MIKYVFFDLDDTLIDNKKAQDLACEYLYNYFNFSTNVNLSDFLETWNYLSEYYYQAYARKEITFQEQRNLRIKDLFSKYNLEMDREPQEIFSLYLKLYEENWCLYDDVLDTLNKLNDLGYKIGIISNGNLKQQQEKLEKTGILKYMIDIIASSEYEFSKPDARIFEVACKKNNILYDEFCYIGNDYEKDIIPCLNLGTRAIWLNRDNLESNKLSEEINSLDELSHQLFNTKSIIKRINN